MNPWGGHPGRKIAGRHARATVHVSQSEQEPEAMKTAGHSPSPTFGSADLRLPEELRGPLRKHLAQLRERYLQRGWGARVGFGQRPALVVIDMARFWLDSSQQIGSDLGPVLAAVCRILEAARAARIPIFF